MTTPNYSIYAIPAFYILALVPQFYSTILINRATNGHFDNVNPRGASFSETCKKSLDKATLGRFERAKAAHANALENFPLFASAVICANMAGLEKGMMNLTCGAFLGLRIAYTFLYIGVESRKFSFVRTLVWMTSVGCCMTLLFKAGNVLVDGKGSRL